uniref:Protein kinase domain-containing protein n=1 Tax=Oryza glaberrima TaxID=4538 RepID=I1PFX9_ORYGL
MHVATLLLLLLLDLAVANGAVDEFAYNGFAGAGDGELVLDGAASVTPDGLLRLTGGSGEKGHAFYARPLGFRNGSGGGGGVRSFTSTFVFGIMSSFTDLAGHGIAFAVSSTRDFSGAAAAEYLGLFNRATNGDPASGSVLAVELDTMYTPEFRDIDDNHVGVDFRRQRRAIYVELVEDWEVEFGPHRFAYKDLHKATKGFHDDMVLGVGGFGKVYKGVMSGSGIDVATKKICHDSKQGMREFIAEIVSLGRLRHHNIVQLLGYCRRKGELLLAYDYMINGSLDKYLYGEARLYDHGAEPSTTTIVGTMGYLDPELTRTSQATTSSDVFAFGAFVLEVVCGRRPVQPRAAAGGERLVLVDWVLRSWRSGEIAGAVDARLGGGFAAGEAEAMLKLALLCTHRLPAARPGMRRVVQWLDGGGGDVLDQLSPGHMDVAAPAFLCHDDDDDDDFVAMSFPSASTATSPTTRFTG